MTQPDEMKHASVDYSHINLLKCSLKMTSSKKVYNCQKWLNFNSERENLHSTTQMLLKIWKFLKFTLSIPFSLRSFQSIMYAYIDCLEHKHVKCMSLTHDKRVELTNVTHHIKTGQLSVECISRYHSICMEKNKENKKKLRLIFDHKIAMLHPIYTWVVSSLR